MKYLVTILVIAAASAHAAESPRRWIVVRQASPGKMRSSARSQGPMGAPVLGLFTNAKRNEVRAIVGVPGAALVGDPLPLPEGLARIYLAPGQAWALAEKTAGGGLTALFFDGADVESTVDFPNSISAIDTIAFAPGGRAAVVYSRESARLQTFVPGNGELRFADLPAAGMDVAQLAIDESGTRLAAVTSDAGVYAIGSDGAAQLVYSGGKIGALTYLRNSTRLLVADADAGQLIAIDEESGAYESHALRVSIATDTGLMQPSADGKSVFLATPGSRLAARVYLAEETLLAVDLPADASRLQALGKGSAFLVSAEPVEPAWLLLDEEQEARVVFAARPTPQEGSAQ